MRFLILVLIFSNLVIFLLAQQCRYVTVPVCDNENASSVGNTLAIKGEKGERGFSGKMGAKGIRGEIGRKGLDGQKGAKGNSAQIEELQDHLSVRLNAMQETLNQLLLPPNCASSSLVGYQMLRSGDQVYCDGGWMVFQKRYDGSVNFQRPWSDYKNGFGNFSTEFWLGLDELHNATAGRGCRLRVDLWSFDDDHAFAEYSDFFVESESDLYRLHIGGYSGTAGNCFTGAGENQIADEMPFTTLDRDNDRNAMNCATNVAGSSGGWWFNNCHHCKLNAEWGRTVGSIHTNFWRQWKGENGVLKASTMKFRCD